MLGNDIVDLASAPRREKEPRFLDRVFSGEERSLIARSGDPHRALWLLWACKESLFKARQRTMPGLVFAHRSFAPGGESLAALLSAASAERGVCFGREGPLQLRWEWSPEFASCCLWSSRAVLRRSRIPAGWTEGDAARELALGFLRDQGLGGARIERPLRDGRAEAPRVTTDGREVASLLVSLSHDGAWAEAALQLETAGDGAQACGSLSSSWAALRSSSSGESAGTSPNSRSFR